MAQPTLRACTSPLWDRYDVAVLDLDGVVYVGPHAVPGAPDHLARAAQAGMHVAYVTNNAARPPAMVAAHLRELGVTLEDGDVVTSAQAAAHLLADQLGPGAPVFVIGGEGLFEALAERGLRPVQDIEADPVAVVSGFHRDLRWGTVVDGAILVRRGLPWVAANTDLSVPTPHGPGPGNGRLVDTVARFAERAPVVAGKPQTPLFEETLARVGGERPLVVGDRLDTDIEGAVNAGYDSLLVMTGVTGLAEIVAAPPAMRPTYLSLDLGGLGETHAVPERAGDGYLLDGILGRVRDGRLHMDSEPDPARAAAASWWRVLACAAWAHLDTTGNPVDVEGLTPPSTVAP